MGILKIIAAIIVFSYPLAIMLITTRFVVYIIAVIILVFGIYGIMTGIRLRKEIKAEWSMLVGGILAVIISLVLFINPVQTAVAFLTLLGVLAIIGGIIQIWVSYIIREIGVRS